MKRNYFLKITRIGFSKWTSHDLPLAITLWSNPQVTKYIASHGIMNKEDIEKIYYKLFLTNSYFLKGVKTDGKNKN